MKITLTAIAFVIAVSLSACGGGGYSEDGYTSKSRNGLASKHRDQSNGGSR